GAQVIAALRPVIAVCGLKALHVLAKAGGTCDSNTVTGSLDVLGDGAGEVTTGGVLPGPSPVKVVSALWGIAEKSPNAARPTAVTLAPMDPATSPRRGPRSRSRVSLAEASRTRASAAGSRRSRKARASAGADWSAKLRMLRYRLVRCG